MAERRIAEVVREANSGEERGHSSFYFQCVGIVAEYRSTMIVCELHSDASAQSC